jgi:hypothetical protein
MGESCDEANRTIAEPEEEMRRINSTPEIVFDI